MDQNNKDYSAPEINELNTDKMTRVISSAELSEIKERSNRRRHTGSYETLAEVRAAREKDRMAQSFDVRDTSRGTSYSEIDSNAGSSSYSASDMASDTTSAVGSGSASDAGSGAASHTGDGAASKPTKKRKQKKSNKSNAEQAPTRTKKKKKHVWLKRFILAILCLMLIAALGLGIFVYAIIRETPPIEPHQIYDYLSETTKMYDDQGVELDTIYFGSNREMASVHDMPENLTNAVIALEDKTFRSHHGFNIIRMFGAIRDALRSGGQISGTSTITQQLARNIYLQETQFDRDIKRKIQEAYYALRLEKELSKDEIIEVYLNAINFGYNSFGVETAAQNYFSKTVSELTLAECAALAALPQMPSVYQLIIFEEGGTAAAYPDTALFEDSDGVYLVNDKSRDRRELCLDLMLDQGLITQAEHDEAYNTPLKDMLNPDFNFTNSNAIYFADYCIDEVINDLVEKKGMDYDTAWTTVYQGGLQIYSTLDSQAQGIIMSEFSNPYNYPWVEPYYDDDGNIIDENGYIKLYDYDNFFDENGNYVLSESEFERMEDGSLKVYYDEYLKIYTTEVTEGTEYSLEFPAMYFYDSDYSFYSLSGGYVNVPREYKSIDADNNLIISKDFFENPDFEGYFFFNDDGTAYIAPKAYSLNPKTIQPQVAMTIVENETGHIKAMVGGRNTSGRMIYNRAVSPRQPGSSIKPLGVYSAALQQSAEEAKEGLTHEFEDFGIDKQGASMYGSYLTAASIVVDEKTTIEGRQWPDNFGGQFTGKQTLRTAMRESINTCAVKIWYQVGAEYSLNNVKKFGISTLVEDGPVNDINAAALALGGTTYGVTTLEMASAYTVFPNNGVRYDTCSYTKVLDKDGNVLLENDHNSTRVLDEGVAWIMADMLHDVVESGTATNAYVPGTFVGGKTGTTSDEKDDWFDGFTMKYSAALWIGSDVAIDLSDSSVIATVLWGNIMRQIDAAYQGERKEKPDNVITMNGEYFVEGTEKGVVNIKDYDTSVYICNDSGLLATPDCPNTTKKEYNSYTGGYTPPQYYCHLHNSNPSAYPMSPTDQESWNAEQAKKAEEEEKLRAEEEERLRAEEEARLAEEEARRAAEEEAARIAEEEARAAEEEAARKAEEEERAREEAERAEEEKRRAEEEANNQDGG